MKFLVGIVLIGCIFNAGMAASLENSTDKPSILTSPDPVSTEIPVTTIKPKDDDPDTTTPVPETTTAKNENTTTIPDNTTTTTAPTTTTVPTTTVPTTTTTNGTTTSTTTTTTTTMAPTTPPPVSTTTMKPEPPRSQWSTTSFIGGMVFAFGMMAIGFVSFKFYKARNERNYHTL